MAGVISFWVMGLVSGAIRYFGIRVFMKRPLKRGRTGGYLSYCYGKLTRITNRLVIFGWSFGESDAHIFDAIAENLDLKQIVVGLYGDADSADNKALIRRITDLKSKRAKWLKQVGGSIKSKRKKASADELEILFFQSESAGVWPQVQ